MITGTQEMAEAMLSYREASLPDLAPIAPAPAAPVTGPETTVEIAETRGPPPDSSHKPEGRTVVISLPPKRQRASPATTTKRVIEEIHSSISQDDRVTALEKACASFDHAMQSVHDEEILAGADAALTKHLAFLLIKKGREQVEEITSGDEGEGTSSPPANGAGNGIMQEISQTCEALEMVYRCSANCVETSFARVGPELLPLLLQVIGDEIRRRHGCPIVNTKLSKGMGRMFRPDNCNSSSSIDTEDSTTVGVDSCKKGTSAQDSAPSHESLHSSTRDLLLRRATKILGHFARVGAATQPIAYHKGLLSSLKRVIDSKAVPIEARLNSLWVVANLACNVENMVMMVCAGLLDVLVRTCHRPADDVENHEETFEMLRARSIAVRAMLNLSWAPENKIPMSEHVHLVDSLTQMLTTRVSPLGGKGRGVSAILLQSRRHAAGALRNLAAAPHRNKLRLCRYKDGLLLDSLCDAAQNDPDRNVKDRVFAAMYNLSCMDTAELMINKPLFLGEVEAMASGDVTPGEGSDAKTLASRILRVLEKSITEDMGCYTTLREVLDRVSSSKNCDDDTPNDICQQADDEVRDTSAV